MTIDLKRKTIKFIVFISLTVICTILYIYFLQTGKKKKEKYL